MMLLIVSAGVKGAFAPFYSKVDSLDEFTYIKITVFWVYFGKKKSK
jgi:hypothetical protein